MDQNYIQFKKQRSLGEIINATFKFLREEYKGLFSYIIRIVSPFFIALLAALVYYTLSLNINPFQLLQGKEDNTLGTTMVGVLVLALALLLFYAAMYGTILSYIKSYIKNNGQVVDEEIRFGVQKNFGKLILLFFLIPIMIGCGMVLLIIPGIYIMVPLSLVSAILIFQEGGVSHSISHCFDLIKDHWWTTLGTLLVIGILVYLIGLIFQLPLFFYSAVKMFTAVQKHNMANVHLDKDWLFLTLTIVANLVQYLLTIITITAIAFIYFDLNEEKNLTGTYEDIDKLGK